MAWPTRLENHAVRFWATGMTSTYAGGLTRRIYLAFLTTAVLPTAVAGIIGVWRSLDRLHNVTVQGLQQEVSARGSGLRMFFNMVEAELQFLATDPQAVALLSLARDRQGIRGAESAAQALGQQYARMIRAQGDIDQVRLLDAKGIERVRVDKRPDGVAIAPATALQDKSDRYYVRAALARPAGSVYVSPLDLNVEHGEVEKPEKPVVRMATTVTDSRGSLLGMVVINLHAKVLIEPVQQMVQAREGTAYLFDRSGHFLARGRDQAQPGFLMQPVEKLGTVSPAVIRELLADTAGNLSADGSIWAHAPVAFLPDAVSADAPRWAIAVSFPEGALLRQYVDLAKLYVVLVGALLIAAVAGFSISRRIIGPLDDLTREADAIAAGDFGRRVHVEGQDEIARLGERFNLMAARLQATLSQLQQQRERLECDVAERTRDLKAERARLAAVLRHASDAIAALRADGELVFANRAAERLLGDAEGSGSQTAAGVLARLVGDARAGREEIVVNGRTLSVNRDILPVEDAPGDLVIVARDVSEERRLLDEKREFDHQVFQTDKMATLGELAMGLAHEIGNPLAGMKAVVQSLLFDHSLSAGVTEDLSRVESEIDRLARFLSSFRGLAAPRPLQLTAQSLAAAVEDMLFWVRTRARALDVELAVDIAKGLPPLSADAAQLRQVLLNLFVNALHAMPQGGRLLVRGAAQGNEVLIEVQDTGCGIPPELQRQIFKPFFTTRKDGSGLGLAVCTKVVEDHGGAIEVRSRPGETRFLVHWPVYAAVPDSLVPTS